LFETKETELIINFAVEGEIGMEDSTVETKNEILDFMEEAKIEWRVATIERKKGGLYSKVHGKKGMVN
jgi:hypothetical protein